MVDATAAIEVLLVEDSETDGELCVRALKKQKLANKLLWVKDGAEALDFLFKTGPYAGASADNRPKIVLLDLKLPKIDGLEVLQKIRGNEKTKTLPVVVLTSSKEERDLKQAYELGANSFITKPVGFESFAATVSNLGFYWLAINRPPPG